MAVSDLGPLLTASEVAEMLHLHVNTVKRLGDRGELPFFRVCRRGDRRFRLEDVMAFLARNARKASRRSRPRPAPPRVERPRPVARPICVSDRRGRPVGGRPAIRRRAPQRGLRQALDRRCPAPRRPRRLVTSSGAIQRITLCATPHDRSSRPSSAQRRTTASQVSPSGSRVDAVLDQLDADHQPQARARRRSARRSPRSLPDRPRAPRREPPRSPPGRCSRISSRTARPAAQATGLPPNVEPWALLPQRSWSARRAGHRRQRQPVGDRLRHRRRRRGRSRRARTAHIRPVRPKPVWTSSATSRIPWRSQTWRRIRTKAGGAGT